MKKIPTNIRLNIQLVIAVVLVLAGLVLLFCGFWLDPKGEIHNSVLVAFGELSTFAGSLIGVDYHYGYKKYISRQEPPPSPNQDSEEYEENN